jgi:integrase/recombinase XerD
MPGTIGKFYQLTFQKELSLKYLYPKQTKKALPKYLIQKEVVKLFSVVQNIKYRCILKLLCGAGLRVSEVIALTPADIDSNQMCIHIKEAKGRKDRTVILFPTVTERFKNVF